MEQYLERQKLPKFTQKEIKNLKGSQSNFKNECDLKTTDKIPGSANSLVIQIFKGKNIDILNNIFQKLDTGIPQLVLWGQQYPNTKTRQRNFVFENYRPISLINIDIKIPNKILGNQIEQHIKR